MGWADLSGFVCEDPDDVNALLHQLRGVQGLQKINAFHCSPQPKEKFTRQRHKGSLARYGFQGRIYEV